MAWGPGSSGTATSRACPQINAVQLNFCGFPARTALDRKLGNATFQASDRALHLGLEIFSDAVGIGERELVASERGHQAPELFFTSCDVKAHLRSHAHFTDAAKRFERRRVVAGLLELNGALKLRARFGKLGLVLRTGNVRGQRDGQGGQRQRGRAQARSQ